MQDKDDIAKRRERLKQLRNRFNTDSQADSEGDATANESFATRLKNRRQAGGRQGGRMAGRGGAKKGGMGPKILTFLTSTSPGDVLVPGTEVGQQNLERFINLLYKLESSQKGAKLVQPILKILSPEKSGGSMNFDPERVDKFIRILQGGGRQGAGRAQAGMAKTAGGFRQGAGMRAGGAGLRRRGGFQRGAALGRGNTLGQESGESNVSSAAIQQTLQVLEKLVQQSASQIEMTQEIISELHKTKLSQSTSSEQEKTSSKKE